MRKWIAGLVTGCVFSVLGAEGHGAAVGRTDDRAVQVQSALREAQALRDAGRLADAADVLAAALAGNPWDEALEFELLSVNEARGVLTAEQSVALAALRQERQAASELAVGAIRLSVLRARARLAQGRYAEAERTAEAAIARLDSLPSNVDRAALRGPLEELLVEIRSLRNAAGASRAPLTASDMGQDPQESQASPPETVLVETRAVTTEYPPGMIQIPAETRVVTTDLSAASAPTNPEPDLVMTPAHEIDAQFLAFQDVQLMRWGEDPLIYDRVLSFPSYWPELCELRKQYASGLLYRGPEFKTDTGETQYMAVYEIADLTADIPHFNSAPILDLDMMLQAGADRVALRQSNDIFTGGPADLAAGIPLLGYFGGVDEYHLPPASPGTQYQYHDIVRMVDEVIQSR